MATTKDPPPPLKNSILPVQNIPFLPLLASPILPLLFQSPHVKSSLGQRLLDSGFVSTALIAQTIV